MQTILYHNSSGRDAFTGNLKQKEVHRAITLHPVKQHTHMYRIHNYMKVYGATSSIFYSIVFCRSRRLYWFVSWPFSRCCRVSSYRKYTRRRSCCTGTYDPWSINWTASTRDRPTSSGWPATRNNCSRPGREVRITWATQICWVTINNIVLYYSSAYMSCGTG